MIPRIRWSATVVACALLAAIVSAQQPAAAGALFRVFLKTGQALPSFGEAAIVGDRVVFTLLVGADQAASALQLMSLPSERVDLARTQRYAEAIRGAHYAATRGEVDYAAIRQEVQRALVQISAVDDPKRRLELAEDAKRRLLAWSAGTYGYRAAEVRELAALFDEVVAELRAATGERQFSLDLRAGPADAPAETILAAPTLRESVELAIQAARASDNEDERLAVLRTVAALASRDASVADLNAMVTREMETEATAVASYATLATDVRARAESARRKGDVPGVEAAIAALHERDRQLGQRRPQTVAELANELGAMLESARTYREALDRYARVRGSLLAYERAVRPIMSGFDGLTPVFGAIRDERYTAFERLVRAGDRVTAMRADLKGLTPPSDVADVHATLTSALQMADYACARRRLSVAAVSAAMSREASSAAAGAMMLATLAREQLVARLYPPKIQ